MGFPAATLNKRIKKNNVTEKAQGIGSESCIL
jgi:hypothetical protein